MPVSAGMKTYLAGNCLYLATLWEVVAVDTTTIRATNHTRPITYGSNQYAPLPLSPTIIQRKAGLSVDNADLQAIISDGKFTEPQLLAAKWSYAAVTLTVVAVDNLALGHAQKVGGLIGEVTIQNGAAQFEYRSWSDVLSQPIGDLASETCRVKLLGDAECAKDLTAFTHATTVATVTDARTFTVSLGTAKADGYFNYGKATFTSGSNNGLAVEIRKNVGNTITLALPAFYTISASDGVTLIAGCDRTRATCRDRFNNVINFRGEPDLPGRDKTFRIPETDNA